MQIEPSMNSISHFFPCLWNCRWGSQGRSFIVKEASDLDLRFKLVAQYRLPKLVDVTCLKSACINRYTSQRRDDPKVLISGCEPMATSMKV